MQNALKVPTVVILQNAGLYSDVDEIAAYTDNGYGICAKTGKEYSNFLTDFSHGIVDPVSVVINSLKVATSIALLILTTEVIIPEREIDGRF